MNKKSANIYQCVISKGNYSVLLTMKDGKQVKDKFSLIEIDTLTTSLNSKEDFVKYLNSCGFDIDNSYDIFIQYKIQGVNRRLDLVYSDMILLKKIIEEDLPNGEKTYLNQIKNEFLIDIKDKKFLDFLKRASYNRYMSYDLKQAVGNYLFYSDDTYDRVDINLVMNEKQKILNALNHYKTVRGVLIGKRHYELMLSGKEIPKDPNILSNYEREILTYILNQPEKSKKEETQKVDDGQMSLFDVSIYTEDVSKKHIR